MAQVGEEDGHIQEKSIIIFSEPVFGIGQVIIKNVLIDFFRFILYLLYFTFLVTRHTRRRNHNLLTARY